MEEYLSKLPIEIFIHVAYSGAGFKPEHKVPKATKEWLRAQPKSLAFTEVWDDLAGTVETERRFHTPDRKETFNG